MHIAQLTKCNLGCFITEKAFITLAAKSNSTEMDEGKCHGGSPLLEKAPGYYDDEYTLRRCHNSEPCHEDYVCKRGSICCRSAGE